MRKKVVFYAVAFLLFSFKLSAANYSSFDRDTSCCDSLPEIEIYSSSGDTVFCADDTICIWALYDTCYNYQWYYNGDTIDGANDSILCNVTDSGEYYVEIWNNCDTIISETYVFVVYEMSVNISITDQISCYGACDGEATVSVTGGNPPYSYEWSNWDSGNSADSICDGIICVTVTDNLGCTAMDCIEFIEPTQLSLSWACGGSGCPSKCGIGKTCMCATVSGGTPPYHIHTIGWTQTGANFCKCVNFNTSYMITIHDANECIVSGGHYCPIPKSGDGATYTDENEMSGNILVYPNPANDKLNIQFIYDQENVSVSLIDILGKEHILLENKTVNGNEIELDLSNYSSGIYIISIKTLDGVYSEKIQIE
ncbi:MAG TPA: hypothetical protein DEA97_18160 [Bacteroidales bacterium]|nr:MAG: hypothetical protein UR43_C0009G0009 [candidate division TM6 bacterium GW2011_GWF2_33_332]OFY79209.1 MAG: hypothetical protein A2281_14695 [Bacteroidetes bacterium RIFOXYA12_FULL_38_20]HBS88489.1 hypothetical protein [Bacteroidales bacterium]